MNRITSIINTLKKFVYGRRWVLTGLLFVFVIRLGYTGILYFHHQYPLLHRVAGMVLPKHAFTRHSPNELLKKDARLYHYLAGEILAGRRMMPPKGSPWKQDIIPPGAPVFFALLHFLFGRSLLVVLGAYVLLDVLNAFLVLLILKHTALDVRPWQQLLLAGIFGIYISYFSYIMMPLSEGLFVFLMLLSFWLYAEHGLRQKTIYVILAGVGWGLAALTRPVALLMPFWLLGWRFLLPAASRKRELFANILMCIMMVLTLLPWGIRNKRVYGRFVLVANNMTVLAHGTDLKSNGGMNMTPEQYKESLDARNESHVRLLYNAVSAMAGQPFAYAKLWALKSVNLLFNIGWKGVRPSWATILLTAVANGLLLVAAIGVLVCRRRELKRLMMPAVVVFYFIFLHVVFFKAKHRYIVPGLPFLMIYVPLFVDCLYRKVTAARYGAAQVEQHGDRG